MRVSGRMLASVFEMLDEQELAGTSTMQVNDLVDRFITVDLDARPASKGQYGFQYVLNCSINHVGCVLQEYRRNAGHCDENSWESLVMRDYDDTIAREATIQVIELLVGYRYDDLEKRTGGVRLSADMLEEAVTQYGKTLVFPPPDALANLDIVPVACEGPKTWSVRADLWTSEEGRSDLTLELTVIKDEGKRTIVELDNLHVL